MDARLLKALHRTVEARRGNPSLPGWAKSAAIASTAALTASRSVAIVPSSDRWDAWAADTTGPLLVVEGVSAISGWNTSGSANLVQNGDFSLFSTSSTGPSGSIPVVTVDGWSTRQTSLPPYSDYRPAVPYYSFNELEALSEAPLFDADGILANNVQTLAPASAPPGGVRQETALFSGFDYILEFSVFASNAYPDGVDSSLDLGNGVAGLQVWGHEPVFYEVPSAGVTTYQFRFEALYDNSPIVLFESGVATENTAGWAQPAGSRTVLPEWDNVVLVQVPEVSAFTLFFSFFAAASALWKRRRPR